MSPAPPLEVVAAVIEHGGLLLVCRRRAGTAHAGSWEFPGGKVEPGESPAAALVREIEEELGAGIRVTGQVTVDDTRVADRVIRLRCLRAVLTGPRPTRSTDHDVLRWVAPADLAALEFTAPDLPAVRLLQTHAALRGAAGPAASSWAVRSRT